MTAAAYYDVGVNHTDGTGAVISEWFSTWGRSDGGALAAFMDGRVKQPGILALSMYADRTTRGPRAVGHGAAVLENADGALDRYLGYALDGGLFGVLRNGSIADRVFNGRVEQCTVDEIAVTLYVRDLIGEYDQAALVTQYAGTNALPAGVEGTPADIKGQRKPMVLGIVHNITPVCVNTSKLIYQVDGQQGLQTGWSMTVYDKRAALTAGANYPDQATMEATAPAAGQYRVWPAGGMLRLGSGLSGQITCDVTNPAGLFFYNPSPVQVTSCEVHVVMAWLMQRVRPVLTAQANTAPGLAAWPDCGIYLTGEATYLQALNELAQSVSMGWFYNPDSTTNMWMMQLVEPSTLASAGTIDSTNIVSLQRVVSADDDRGIPAWRVNVNYLRNYTVMQPSELAGVAIADVIFCGQEYRTAIASDASVQTQWPAAPEITVDTLLVTEADAAAEAARLLALYKVRRDIFTLEVPESVVADVKLAQRRDLVYPRFGLDAGKAFQVIGMQPNFDKRTVQLTVWG